MQSSLVAQGLQGATSGGEEERVERSKGHSVCTMSALPPYSTYRTDSKVSSLAVGSCYSRIQNPAFASCEKHCCLWTIYGVPEQRWERRKSGVLVYGTMATRCAGFQSIPGLLGRSHEPRVTATSLACLVGRKGAGRRTRGSCTPSVPQLAFYRDAL